MTNFNRIILAFIIVSFWMEKFKSTKEQAKGKKNNFK